MLQLIVATCMSSQIPWDVLVFQSIPLFRFFMRYICAIIAIHCLNLANSVLYCADARHSAWLVRFHNFFYLCCQRLFTTFCVLILVVRRRCIRSTFLISLVPFCHYFFFIFRVFTIPSHLHLRYYNDYIKKMYKSKLCE